MELRSAFDLHPKEAAIVGRILAEYSELEFELSQLTGKVLNDMHRGLRAIFRAKGEETRINIADALIRSELIRIELGDQYEAMLGAIRHCKKIRNQYAHAHWTNAFDEHGLAFVNLEESAESKIGPTFVKPYDVDLNLLKKQEEYFQYTSRWLYFLIDEYDFRVGKSPSPATAPKIIEKPNLYIPLKTADNQAPAHRE